MKERTSVKLTLAYDGTDFHGFARQPGLRTVQGELEKWLSEASERPVEVIGASRTDAGVHAGAQAVQFAADSLKVPPERLMAYARGTLPHDLTIRNWEVVPADFHVRFAARWKTYRYMLDLGQVPDVFVRRFATHVPQPLSEEAMREGASALHGTHDFTSFCAAKAEQTDKVRTIYRIHFFRQSDDLMAIDVTGNGFLYHMVRNIVGTLVEVGKGKIPPTALAPILEAHDRRAAGPTAPPQGLTLWHIEYHKDWLDDQ